ncbi:MAG: hypothetical protein K6C36_03410 [Clostridia bacterium]|nr:hypothetical protein [Clostridia bacterium]
MKKEMDALTEARAYLGLFRPGPDDLSEPDIRALLDAELEKEDPDTDLIEYCLDALEEPLPLLPARRASHAPRRALLIAAAVVLLTMLGAAAAASAIRPELWNSLVRLYSDTFRIGHPDKSGTGGYELGETELALRLASLGVSPVLLPEALTDGTCTVDSVTGERTDFITSATVTFSSEELRGTMFIAVYAEGAALPVMDYAGAKDAEPLHTDRIDGFIFSQGDGVVIDFSDGRTVYSIVIDSTREAALDLAQGIR